MNISSVVVIPRPEAVEAVVARLTQLEGVEVALVSPEGKIIATIELDGDAETVQTYEAIGTLDDVLSVALVYHHKETEPDAVICVPA